MCKWMKKTEFEWHRPRIQNKFKSKNCFNSEVIQTRPDTCNETLISSYPDCILHTAPCCLPPSTPKASHEKTRKTQPKIGRKKWINYTSDGNRGESQQTMSKGNERAETGFLFAQHFILFSESIRKMERHDMRAMSVSKDFGRGAMRPSYNYDYNVHTAIVTLQLYAIRTNEIYREDWQRMIFSCEFHTVERPRIDCCTRCMLCYG